MNWFLIGSKLSPFSLKVEALLQHCGEAYQQLPNSGYRLISALTQIKVWATRKGILKPGNPAFDSRDDLPLVPYLYRPSQPLIYDSSYIAEHLAQTAHIALHPTPPLDRFIHDLIEDFADELGLYIVHHHRWVTSRDSNNAGARLAAEWRPLLGPIASLFGRWFAKRQIRRLPYLFSVAANHPALPSTHALLEEISARWLAVMEQLTQQQPYLFGTFSAADAAIYGQWSMNLDDPCANKLIQQSSPSFHHWVSSIRRGQFQELSKSYDLERLAPLLAIISEYFLPLMAQNHQAWQAMRSKGQTRFNEAAFNRGEALYQGQLAGHSFTSVAKSFQAKVWEQRLSQWAALPPNLQQQAFNLGLKFPPNHISQQANGAGRNG